MIEGINGALDQYLSIQISDDSLFWLIKHWVEDTMLDQILLRLLWYHLWLESGRLILTWFDKYVTPRARLDARQL